MSFEQDSDYKEAEDFNTTDSNYYTHDNSYGNEEVQGHFTGEETEEHSSPKKRKIDKDGFVCPATPDIPVTSCHYGQPKHHSADHESIEHHHPETEETGKEQHQSYEEDVAVPTDDQPPQSETITDSDTKDRTGMTVAEVVQELGEESKTLYNQWSNMFRESEDFENFCPIRLDKMIQQAKLLEQSLLKQKELLCTRLNVISHIIRTSITEGPGGDN